MGQAPQRTSILIVEDESIIARDIQESLEALSYQVTGIAVSGEEALRMIDDARPDIVLMDIVLQGEMDGIETARVIHDTYSVPVVYLSAYTDEGVLERAKLTEPFGYLIKPFDRMDLRITVEMAIYKSKAEEELQRHREHLSDLVDERTRELKQEIIERKRIESELRESELILRTLFERALNPIMKIDEQGRYIDANRAAFEFLECGRAELVEKTIWDFVSPEQLEKQKHEHTPAFANRTIETSYLVNGKIKTLLLNVVSLHLFGRMLIYGIGQDMTERKKHEEELVKAQKLESMGILAGGIAHDFNNILTSVLTNLSLAKTDIDKGGVVFRRLMSAEKALQRAQNLTQQLLTFSMGGEPIRKVSSVVDLLWESADFAIKGSNVRCRYDIGKSIWPVHIDESQISQVINNLVINSMQAMPAGGTIDIKVQNKVITDNDKPPLSEGRYVAFSVADKGVGISEGDMGKIFDPYFTTKHEGSGLGLASAYSIIKKHDGHVEVKSVPGKHTSFTVYLPASDGEMKRAARVEEKVYHGNGRVLVMDDDSNIRESLSDALDYFGYDVDFTETGEKTIEKYRQAQELNQPFDAVIMDLTIPGGIGGAETIGRLLEIDPEVKAIVSSGYSNNPVMANYRKYGFSGMIMKPYRVEELSRILHQVIGAEA